MSDRLKASLIRFAKVVLAAAAGAGITVALNALPGLALPVWAVGPITAVLLAAEKYVTWS